MGKSTKNYELRDAAVMLLGQAKKDRVRYERTVRQYVPLALTHGMSVEEIAIVLGVTRDEVQRLAGGQ